MEKGGAHRQTLLEYLAEAAGCVYISELSFPLMQRGLYRLVAPLPVERFPAGEWTDALEYLTLQRKAAPLPPEAAKARLLEALQERAAPCSGNPSAVLSGRG